MCYRIRGSDGGALSIVMSLDKQFSGSELQNGFSTKELIVVDEM
jgi:hypothetical protein